MITVLENCTIFDGFSEELVENGTVVIEKDRIREVSAGAVKISADVRINCGDRFLMPGLIDCHFHAYASTFDIYGLDRMPMSLLSQHAAALLTGTLHRGFTTVRDAGGGDIGLSMALEQRLIQGPRFFFSGKAISQSGGHGDMRPPKYVEPCLCAYRGILTRVVDGVDEMRRAVREELHRGATQIKIFVSGGVISPGDPIWMAQFSSDEIAAAVEEAASRRTYVMAHCHTDERARVCVEQGVRSIEHGTEISPATATLIAESGTFVVPTLSIAAVVRDSGKSLGLPAKSLETASELFDRMQKSIETCVVAGVKLGLGTDLFGDYHNQQGRELQFRGETAAPVDVLRSATSINAEILQRQGDLGCVSEGAYSDLILLEKNPLNDLSLFAEPDKNIKLIIRAGEIVKNALGH